MPLDYSHVEKGHVKVEIENKIAVATLNRPDRMNAMGDGMHDAIEEFLHMVNFDPDVNCVVWTGAGRGFCAGGDVKAMGDRATGASEAQGPLEILRGAKYLVQRFVNCEVPMVAAINGPAIGLGATIALLNDVTFMAESARIGDNHVKVGITAGDGGAVIWPHLIGPHRAKELLMSGDLIYGPEAARIGLVNHCVPDDKLMEEAMAYAKKVADGASVAIRFTKIAVNKHLWDSVNLIMDYCLVSERMAMNTQDHIEATTAFKEKRQPQFTGR
jgi:enoyl-CoA hydratase/carnithine racemase